jgi:hypothetical protein
MAIMPRGAFSEAAGRAAKFESHYLRLTHKPHQRSV